MGPLMSDWHSSPTVLMPTDGEKSVIVVRNPVHYVRRVEGMRVGDGPRLGGIRNSGGRARSWMGSSAVSGFGEHGAAMNTPCYTKA